MQSLLDFCSACAAPVKNLSHGQSFRRKCSYNAQIFPRITLAPNACKEKLIRDLLQTLYTYPDNFRAYKALIAAKYSGASVKTDPKFVFGETNKSKQFLSKFPFGKVMKPQFILLFHGVASLFVPTGPRLRGQ